VSCVVDGLFLAFVLGALWLFGGRIKAAIVGTKCPYCLTQIKKKATRCPACQKNLFAGR
jgi:hypothetical protein